MRCCLLTRLSCSRAGARLSTRGIDTEGRVAVFAETEQIISILEEGILASFIQVNCCCCCCCCCCCLPAMQIRGSVPLFWEQRSYQAEQHRISFTRRFHCTTPAFLKHFNDLIRRYGRILILDLLGQFYIFCVQIPFEVWFSLQFVFSRHRVRGYFYLTRYQFHLPELVILASMILSVLVELMGTFRRLNF